MIIDSSAIVAIHEGEPERQAFVELIGGGRRPRVSAATYVEAAIVLDRRPSTTGQSRLDDLLDSFGIEVVPFTAEHARAARRAHQRFGRGSGHPAGLNLGDCFSYALAMDEDEPLLFKGDDFGHTDVIDARDA
ncbi:type II toxin-antitoxin system VapC family toxin [Knoellia subterranea]|uniref:Ribonuclease VapC n=1 Tax=Knoellia subterranea KCTC 19937 TaxID=1385521 RepID=A0A0A0JP30_9MICO|nr:type II toxin-antitoxin system VapC family toxin [Knoellia subterranea]KGN37371.1 ribonuclease [Knoellia subterranea KCTC 19937]